MAPTLKEIVGRCESLFDDLNFTSAKEWKAAPSFCDPALLDRPMLQSVLTQHKIPYTAFKYAENTGQMAPIREQAGAFADSIKLWSAA